ncbi:MAG: tetratricopeptide repeat protein [Saprospiraceae bacterium]
MKSNYLTSSCFALLVTMLFFTACQEVTTSNEVLKASLGTTNAYPELLDRSEAIQNGKEWDLVQNQYSDALNALRKKSTDHEAAIKMVQVFINEARVTGEHGHYYPAALKVIDGVLATKPESEDIQFQAKSLQASVLLSQHEFEKALKAAQEGAQLYSYNAGIHGSLTDAYVELGDYKKAVATADKMMNIRPDLRSYSRISYLREIYGDIDGAIEAMKLAVTAGYPGYEQTAWARLTLGNLYESQGNLDAAEGTYKTILQNRPNYSFAIAALAGVAEKRGDLVKAEKLLKEACAIIPEFGFFVQLAALYQATDRQAKADELIKEIWVMLQDDVDSGHNMNMEYCQIYLDLIGDYDKALTYALKEYEKRPENIDVNKLVAIAYYKKGDYANAQEHVEKAGVTNSKNGEFLLVKGMTAEKLGNVAAGKTAVKTAMKNNPYLSNCLTEELK